jgi:hypothetical protein
MPLATREARTFAPVPQSYNNGSRVGSIVPLAKRQLMA